MFYVGYKCIDNVDNALLEVKEVINNGDYLTYNLIRDDMYVENNVSEEYLMVHCSPLMR